MNPGQFACSILHDDRTLRNGGSRSKQQAKPISLTADAHFGARLGAFFY